MASQHRFVSASISRLASRIPQGTWDTHMHVVDPNGFPLSKDAQYQPPAHTMDDAHAFLDQLGIERMVIVQPSIYGNDNSCTLDGLVPLGPSKGRAVIQFDPDETSQAHLKQWHELGVRGVRLNFKSVGAELSADMLAMQLHKYADAVRGLGWVLETYIALEDVPLLEPIIPQLGDTKVCIDHFGHPSPESLASAKTAHDLPGFASLLNLLAHGSVWVKISASYRLDKDPKHRVVESLCREIVRSRPDRCVFATDWPHTRFNDLDVGPYLEAIFDWVEDEDVPLHKILVQNAEGLFDAKGSV